MVGRICRSGRLYDKSKKAFSYDKMFAVIFLISIISLLLMKLVDILQKRLMPWEHVK